jgi:ribosomal protein L37AE/L43A
VRLAALLCLSLILAGAAVGFLGEAALGAGLVLLGFIGLLGLLLSGSFTTLSQKYPRFQIRFGKRRARQYCPTCGSKLVYRYSEEPEGWWCPICQETVDRPSLSPRERYRKELERRKREASES